MELFLVHAKHAQSGKSTQTDALFSLIEAILVEVLNIFVGRWVLLGSFLNRQFIDVCLQLGENFIR